MIPKEDLMLLFKSKHELKSLDDAGNVLVLQNGEVLKDDLRNPVKVETVLNEFTSLLIFKNLLVVLVMLVAKQEVLSGTLESFYERNG